MATQISRAFKDISLSFTKNPLTNDLIVLQNENAIKKSVMNLVRTQIGERFFNPLIGTPLEKTLFELNLEEVSISLGSQIQTLLENFEPRIRIKDISVSPEEDQYELNIQIAYDIVGLPFPSQTVEFILQPTRL